MDHPGSRCTMQAGSQGLMEKGAIKKICPMWPNMSTHNGCMNTCTLPTWKADMTSPKVDRKTQSHVLNYCGKMGLPLWRVQKEPRL